MKYIILLVSLISIGVKAETICEEHAVKEGNAFTWTEADFNEKAASESMKSLQQALNSDGEIGACHLPNALAIVQGYILKKQAQKALASTSVPKIVKKYNVEGFCDFLKNNKPCE
jgi:hypothetical protein